jgi:hypothetical protein
MTTKQLQNNYNTTTKQLQNNLNMTMEWYIAYENTVMDK